MNKQVSNQYNISIFRNGNSHTEVRMKRKVSDLGLIDQVHKIELRDFVTKRSYCADKRCKFYGELAEQGVCYTRVGNTLSKYFEELFKRADAHLKFNRKHNYKKLSQKQLIRHLESEVVCHFLNSENTLRELIYLRGENAKLRGKMKQDDKGRSTKRTKSRKKASVR